MTLMRQWPQTAWSQGVLYSYTAKKTDVFGFTSLTTKRSPNTSFLSALYGKNLPWQTIKIAPHGGVECSQKSDAWMETEQISGEKNEYFGCQPVAAILH